MVHRIALAMVCLVLPLACQRAAATRPAGNPVSPASAMPTELGQFRLTEQRTLGDGGRLYRYRDTSTVFLTVFRYPITAAAAQRSLDPAARARWEGENFLRLLPIQQQRGIYTTYQLVVSRPDSVRVASRIVPGHMLAVSTLRRAQPEYELQYVYLLGDDFVKVRATIPAAKWPRADLPELVSALVTRLARP